MVELSHPEIPPQLNGLRILHLTDLHIRRGRPITPQLRKTMFALRRTPADLVFLTGDIMHRRGDEHAALQSLEALASAWSARLGAFGVFGNHDSVDFANAAKARTDIPIQWLVNENCDVGTNLRIVGASYPEDVLTAVGKKASVPGRLSLAISHYPTEIFTAAELGLPLLFCGHTHGGQFRLNKNYIPHTSCDLPGSKACGLLRFKGTVCAISRGLGTALLQFRVNCPSQIPLYILRRGPLPSVRDPLRIEQTRAW